MMHVGPRALAVGLLSVLAQGGALAQQAPAPPLPVQQQPVLQSPTGGAAPPLAAVPPVPAIPPSQLAAARDLVNASGITRSFQPMVPQLREQIVPMLTRTRPDLTQDLGIVIKQLSPEFDKKIDDMIDIAAGIYARQMSEAEMKEAAAFFNSPVGKKYVTVQPLMLDDLVVAMQAWTQTISSFMMTRIRDEMIKKGHQF